MSILIKKALLGEKRKDILIENNKISKISDSIKGEAEHKINAENQAIIPSFFNAHTHAAMTLLRGYADDMELHQWLTTKIWPLEAKMNEDDIYWGSKLACLDMVKTGTTFFNDMYWHIHGTARAVEEAGIRAEISPVFIDFGDQKKASSEIELNKKLLNDFKRYGSRIKFELGPHAIYTVSKESLIWAKEFAEKNNLLIHIHLSETEKEVNDCIAENKLRPVEYLEKIGFLGKNVIACHAVWLNDKEISILAKNKVQLAHNPTSNMKLAGGNFFRYKDIAKAGMHPCLGTDGCSSNNNLDMFEEMKVAAIKQKYVTNDPTALSAEEVFRMATSNGAKAFNVNAGEIKEGKLADLLLINLKTPEMVPCHNLISNLVYSANGSVVNTTICDGKILMRDRKVEGEEEILDKAAEVAKDLAAR